MDGTDFISPSVFNRGPKKVLTFFRSKYPVKEPFILDKMGIMLEIQKKHV
jgi:hypothetical protein